jgi:hypothetical protein
MRAPIAAAARALDIDPATGDFLMTTNRGFLRIDARTHAVARVRARFRP